MKDSPSPTPAAKAFANRSISSVEEAQKPVRKICCIGAGYVGGPTCAVIANKNPHIQVTIVDLSQERIKAWKSDDLPIAEPELLDVVKVARDGAEDRPPNLFFSTNVEKAITEADLIFVAVNTPTKTSGYGAQQAADMSYFERAIQMIARLCQRDTIIVEKSTVPCGTANWARQTLAAIASPEVKFEILSNPEFLAEGTAIFNLLHPDRVLIGSETTESGLRAMTALSDVYAAWIPRDRIIAMNTRSAELAKLAANALLAQRISSINALSAICEATGADVDEVAFACGLDMRIGPRMLKASVGYGGSCLKKDVLNLAHFSSTLGLTNVSSYWKSVDDINEYQKDRFSQRIIMGLHNTLTDRRIAIWGYAFKKDTGDIRQSAAISVVARLIDERADLHIYDPQVKTEDIWRSLEVETGKPRTSFADRIHISSSAYEACTDAHAIVIVTEWNEFGNKSSRLVPIAEPNEIPTTVSDFPDISPRVAPVRKLPHGQAQGLQASMSHRRKISSTSKPANEHRVDWNHVATLMQYPKIVFDGRNIVDPDKLAKIGFQVECIGKEPAGFSRRNAV